VVLNGLSLVVDQVEKHRPKELWMPGLER